MAKTQFNKVNSQDILSAHINGLASGINNLETALDMKTSTIEGHILVPVNDMDEVENRNRIYEGAIRNWIQEPIVKRNGVVVPSTEYVSQPAYGVIVFHNSQLISDVISVNVSYINTSSTRLETIESDVLDLKGSQGSANAIKWFNGNGLNSSTGWFTNFNKSPKMPVTAYTSTKWINDFVPVVVTEQTVVDKLKFWFTSTASADAETVMAIYDTRYDLGFPYPKNCLGKTSSITLDSSSPEGWKEAPLYVYKPIENSLGELEVVLEPGIYWIGKATYDTLSSKGFHKTNDYNTLITITPPADGFPAYSVYGSIGTDGEAYAVRAKMTSWTLPASFPSPSAGAIGFYGTGITNVFMRKAR